LAVDRQTGGVQAGDQLAVRQAVNARFGVDARDPQRTHVALVRLAIAIRVLAGLDDGLLRDAEDLAAGVVVALGLLEDLLVTGAGDDASLNACHVSLLYLACGSNCSKRTRSCFATMLGARS